MSGGAMNGGGTNGGGTSDGGTSGGLGSIVSFALTAPWTLIVF